MGKRFIQLHDAMFRCGAHVDDFQIDESQNRHINWDALICGEYTLRQYIIHQLVDTTIESMKSTNRGKYDEWKSIFIYCHNFYVEIPNTALPDKFIIWVTGKDEWKFGHLSKIEFKLKDKNNHYKYLYQYAKGMVDKQNE